MQDVANVGNEKKQQKQIPSNRNNMIDLLDLFRLLLNGWKPILLCILIGATIMGLYNVIIVKSNYCADAKIYITNTDSLVNFSDLQLTAALTDDYKDIITSRTVLTQVIETMDLDMECEDLKNLISIENPTDTHILHIFVTCDDIEMSRNIANTLLNISVEQIHQIVGSDEPNVIDYAEAKAIDEVRPSLKMQVMMGALIGFILSYGFLFLLYSMDKSIKTEDEVNALLQVPVLSAIPYYDEEKPKKDEDQKKGKKNQTEQDAHMIVPELSVLPFQVREAFNVLRGNIQLSGYDVKAIAVTSAVIHEGKSIVAFRLAKSLAGLNKRVLFIDADIRNSQFKVRWQITKKTTGLSDYLCGKEWEKDIIFHTDDPWLDLVLTGSAAPNPSELISGPLFGKLMQSVRDVYDFIIVDTPPVNAVIDGVLIAEHCDGVLMVVESGQTQRDQVVRAKRQLQYANIKVLGAVLNKAGQHHKRYGYGKYGYGYGYSYGYGEKAAR